MNSRQECLANIKGIADTELYNAVASYGNKHLNHVWDFTEDDVLKVMTAMIGYCITVGHDPEKSPESKSIMLKRVEWGEGEARIRLDTWATYPLLGEPDITGRDQ